MSKNVADLLKEVIEERKTDPEKFIEKIEIDPLIDELVQIEKRHKYQLDKSNTRNRRVDLREKIDEYINKQGAK
tara:strand:+ start:19 stop:240 length:222 start_codon:yes stop_codon:yes gene_type:complete